MLRSVLAQRPPMEAGEFGDLIRGYWGLQPGMLS